MILNCPHCENEFYVRDELAGETVNCHKCKQPVQAPAMPVPNSDKEGSIVTSFDSRQGSKPGTENESLTKVQYDSNVRITLGRGFRRLSLFTSIMLGPIIYFAFAGAGGFTVNDYLLLVRSICPFLESANETVRVGVEFIAIWTGSFIAVWVIYLFLSFFVRGFYEVKSKKPKTNS